jgi:ABC-2 type transport system permease protein
MIGPSARRSIKIGQTELRVAWRAFRSKNRLQQVVLGVAGAFGIVFLLAIVGGAYLGGAALAGGQEPAVDDIRLLPAGLFVGIFTLTAYLTAIQYGETDIREGLLTTVSYRDLVGGLLVATFARIWLVMVLPLVCGAIAFGVGVGDASTALLTVLALVVVVLPGYTLGFGVGLGVKHLFSQSETLVRYRTAIGITGFLAYIAVLVTGNVDRITEPVLTAVGASPIAWVGDLALLSLSSTASPIRASSALVGGILLGAVGVLGTQRAAEALWYTDPVETDNRTVTSTNVDRLASVVGREAAWVATKSWIRARRAPLKLVYVVYPLVLLIEPIQSSLASGTVAITVPAFTAVYGAWATGAAFGLNPLGDEGAVLPITVTSGVSGREVVGGLMVAGLVPGLPLTVVLTGVLAALSPLSTGAAVAMTVGAIGLCIAATGVGVGVGTAFPRYDAASLTRSQSVVVPSTWAFIVYTLVVTVLAAPATATQVPVVHETLGDLTGLGGGALQLGGMVLALVLVGSAALLGTRTAIRRFDEYHVT